MYIGNKGGGIRHQVTWGRLYERHTQGAKMKRTSRVFDAQGILYNSRGAVFHSVMRSRRRSFLPLCGIFFLFFFFFVQVTFHSSSSLPPSHFPHSFWCWPGAIEPHIARRGRDGVCAPRERRERKSDIHHSRLSLYGFYIDITLWWWCALI